MLVMKARIIVKKKAMWIETVEGCNKKGPSREEEAQMFINHIEVSCTASTISLCLGCFIYLAWYSCLITLKNSVNVLSAPRNTMSIILKRPLWILCGSRSSSESKQAVKKTLDLTLRTRSNHFSLNISPLARKWGEDLSTFVDLTDLPRQWILK